MAKTHKPHDQLFKQVFGDKEVARDFLRNFLPAPLRQNLQLDRLRLANQSFVDPTLSDFYADLVYEC
ncbi:MAG: hypothetical protein D6730_22285, partial [Bacteroidetes bacterium]